VLDGRAQGRVEHRRLDRRPQVVVRQSGRVARARANAGSASSQVWSQTARRAGSVRVWRTRAPTVAGSGRAGRPRSGGARSALRQPRPAEPEEQVAAIVFLAPDAASNINGVVLPVDDGWSAV
jgi:NAD(P)-dependent dehydrogenase (short-subunit alcohol dehydrogenase family)